MTHSGAADCPGCGLRVLFAVTPDGDVTALDPDESGLVAAWQDDDGTARCRPVGADEQLALGEYFFRLHDPQCPALAPVTPITAAPSLRPRRQPVTGGRRVGAR